MTTYNKQVIRHGLGTLDIRHASDLVDTLNAVVVTNAIRTPDGGWTSRPGQTPLVTSATSPMHSIVRGRDPQSGTTRFYWGNGTLLQHGSTGILTTIASSFSGSPLSLCPWRVTQSGESWVIVGDTNKIVKVRVSDNLVLPVGLPIPASACTTTLATENKKTIDDCTAGWTSPGYTFAPFGGLPVMTYVAADWSGASGNCLNFATVIGAATANYNSFTDKALNLDLSTFGGGVAASDDDYIHLWLRVDKPALVSEVRVYFTTGAWATGTLPGQSTAVPPVNTNGYYKTFRPSDSTAILGGTTAVAAAPIIVSRRIGDDGVKTPIGLDEDTTGNLPDPSTVTIDTTNNTQTPSSQQVPGNSVWTEWGSIGIPLRRGDFQPIGESPDWSSVKGITLYVGTNSAVIVNVRFDDIYMTGGAGPDTGEPGTQKYDVVATNYDPRTGAESNASATQVETNWLDALRRGITADPPAFGDAAVRQRFYIRGGTNVDNWRFGGVNSTDGGTFTITATDTELLSEETVPDDYFQPVPSVLANGTASLAKPVPYIWGPLQGLIFAAGDPNRPGSIYWCHPDKVDAWGANAYVDVSAPSEAITGGFILGSQAFAWSTARLFALNVNFGDSASVTSTVTGCTRGPVTPWAFTVGNGIALFCAYDGIFGTDGGAEHNFTDEWLRPLFQGETAHGLSPVDLNATTAIALWVYNNELYFAYQDTLGARQVLVYHLIDHLWRHAAYGVSVNVGYPDATIGIGRLILGGTNGTGYTASGTSDAGTAITARVVTGDLNQGYMKSLKRYSDFTVDANTHGVPITITPKVDYSQSSATPVAVTTSTREPVIKSFPIPAYSATMAFDYTWSTVGVAPTLYTTTLSFELEPPTVQQWNSLPTDHGIDGWHVVSAMYLTLRSFAEVTLSVVNYSQTGTATTKTYTIPSTAGDKVKRFIPFDATKGAEYSYQLTSPSPFTIYDDASYVTVAPLNSTQSASVRLISLPNEGSTGGSAFTSLAATTAGG